MRKILLMIIAVLTVFSVSGCGKENTEFKNPPSLSVTYDKSSIQALRGTSSWEYKEKIWSSSSTHWDSQHPLDSKESMKYFELLNTSEDEQDLTAYLKFEAQPDTVTVCCWSENFWEQTDAESEDIKVDEVKDKKDGQMFQIELKDGGYIYEVIAEWNSNSKYGGTARYSFYTVKSMA